MMTKRVIFYSIAGAGLGNAARFEAIYESLKDELAMNDSLQIHLFCWGRSYQYLSKYFESYPEVIIHLQREYQLPVSHGALALSRLITLLPILLFNFLCNNFAIFMAAIKFRPSVSVHDSDYHYFPLLLLCIPRIAISQSGMILHNSALLSGTGLKTRLNYYIYEVSEYLFTYLFASKVFCPSFDPTLSFISPKYFVLPPIVRKCFRQDYALRGDHVGVFTGGSGLGADLYRSISTKFQIDGHFSDGSNLYCAIDEQGRPVLVQYSKVIIQAGHILASECLSLGVDVLTIPIANHPEQVINSKILCYYHAAKTFQSEEQLRSFVLSAPSQDVFAKRYQGAPLLARELISYE